MLSRRTLLLASIATLACARPRPVRAGATILTLRGAAVGGTGTAALDLAALDALPQTRFVTASPWQEAPTLYSGVLLRDCLAALGAPAAGTLRLTALNDYVVEADTAELVAASALLATRVDGEPLAVDDKGPVFVVFPFDGRPELRHQVYYSRAVWQLASIEIRP